MSTRWFVAIELHVFLGAAGRAHVRGESFLPPGPAALAAAKRRGLRTAVAAHDRAYYGEAHDHLVDAWVETDTRDALTVARAVHELPGEVAAVHSFVDTFVGTAAAVNRLLGLPGADPLAPGLARNKAVARRSLTEAGVESVRFGTARVEDDPLTSPIGYPCIAKPVDGAASWDVRLVENDADVHRLAEEHAARVYGRGVRPRGELVFEEYLSGPLWSVEGWVSDGEVEIFGWTNREQAEPPDFAELSFGFAADEPTVGADGWARATLAALGYDLGPFHLEAILTPQGLRLLELNPRLVGCGAHPCISLVCGVDVVDHVVGRILGERSPLPRRQGAATARLVTTAVSGQVVAVEGLDDLAGSAGFVGGLVGVDAGDTVESGLRSNAAHLGYVLTVGRDRSEADHRATEAAARVTIVVVDEAREVVA